MYAFVGKEEMAKRLVALRGSKKSVEVAKCVGISTTALSNYEQGIRIPRDDVKARLANYYKVPIESIFFV